MRVFIRVLASMSFFVFALAAGVLSGGRLNPFAEPATVYAQNCTHWDSGDLDCVDDLDDYWLGTPCDPTCSGLGQGKRYTITVWSCEWEPSSPSMSVDLYGLFGLPYYISTLTMVQQCPLSCDKWVGQTDCLPMGGQYAFTLSTNIEVERVHVDSTCCTLGGG